MSSSGILRFPCVPRRCTMRYCQMDLEKKPVSSKCIGRLSKRNRREAVVTCRSVSRDSTVRLFSGNGEEEHKPVIMQMMAYFVA